MDRDEYELFERLPDCSLYWRGLVRGVNGAWSTVSLLAGETGNECFAMDLTASEIVIDRTPLRGAKRIFQIAYSKALAMRAHLLRSNGYDVTSVSSNQVAQVVLNGRMPCDLFVIGHGACDPVRTAMVRWLRAHYPNVRIVALNQDGHVIDDLNYNAPSEPESAWLPLVSAAVARRGHIGHLS